MDLYKRAKDHGEVETVAAVEDDPATREQLARDGLVKLTHSDYREMLQKVDCDTVAVGDYYGRRGEIIIAAMQAGKHV
ncbi:MAG: gfo/Idh/MocA family oxidoreductase, partial [Phycisphaerae bacterium]|nr:gfo/Idh/MocA family oxidoreductase [Phycisphaerae bacterium]